MRICLLHIGGNTATVYSEDTEFHVFVDGRYHRAFSALDSAREYAIKVLSSIGVID